MYKRVTDRFGDAVAIGMAFEMTHLQALETCKVIKSGAMCVSKQKDIHIYSILSIHTLALSYC